MGKEETNSGESREIAIKVEGLSKTFRVPHEKHSSLRSAALNMFSRKGYENFEALKDISFEIEKGEFFGIIGRNGSGKSTLLKMLAGIYVPDSGTIEINGKLSPFLELGVGFNPELTGRENLFLGGAILGLSQKEVAEKYDKIVAFSELGEFMDMKLKNYSSGMQVRLAFTLAINAHAEILLMDEVLAVGDSNFQAKCLDEFNSYRDQGKTVVLVTHDIDTIQQYCDRAMLLRSGKIVKIGKADEVGNEYMYQNMSDEEERVRSGNASDIPGGDKQINKVVEVTKVEYLDKGGIIKNVFETGENISIKVYFDHFQKDKKLNFGIGIWSQGGDYILGASTLRDKIDTGDFAKRGYFQFDINNLNLLTNTYYVNVSIVKDNFKMPYDVVTKSKYFRVVSKRKNQGLVDLDYTWRK